MGRLNLRIELNVVAAAVPDVTRVAQKIVHLVTSAFHFAELVDWNIDVRILLAVGIKVNDDKNDIVAGRGHFSVEQNRRVVGMIETKIIVKLQRAIFSADLI